MNAETINRPLLHRVSWGALFAGFFVGFATWLLLLALGAGIGGASFDARDLSSWRSLGIGIGIWGVIAAIIAYFVAGWVTARLSLAQERIAGVLHGVALWGLMLVVGVWVAATAVAGAVGGAASAAGNAAGGVASAAGNAAQGAAQSQQGRPQRGGQNPVTAAIAGQVAAGMNGWLKDQGMKPIPPQQMQSAIGNIGQDAMAKLQRGVPANQAVDRQTVVRGLTQAGVPRDEAQRMSAQMQQQLSQGLSQAGQQVQETAGNVGEAAATAGTAAAWGFFVYALLTLIAAALGGALGTPGDRRTPVVREEVAPTRPLSPQRA
jgi:hypothetical protein